jgi:hypothetical protein
VRNPDFAFGIVPPYGEYGFETQPAAVDKRVKMRVQDLAASFEWKGPEISEPVAIALDPGTPVLVARYTIDPRDPKQRISLFLQVWTASDQATVESLVGELWPSQEIGITKKQFLESSGRRIAGTDAAFSASGFYRVWGPQLNKVGENTTTVFDEPTVDGDNKHENKRTSSEEKTGTNTENRNNTTLWTPLLVSSLALMTLACLGFVFNGQKLSTENKQIKQDLARIGQKWEDLQKEFNDLKNREQLLIKESRGLRSEIQEKERAIRSLEESNAILAKEIDSFDPEKADQINKNVVKWEELRKFAEKYERNIEELERLLNSFKKESPRNNNWFDYKEQN